MTAGLASGSGSRGVPERADPEVQRTSGLTFSQIELVCPRGHPTRARVPLGSPEAQERDALLQALEDGLTCQACGVSFQLEGGLAWLDRARRHFLQCFAPQRRPEWRLLETQVQERLELVLAQGTERADAYQVRVVFGVPALLEKLLLWEAGFDDRLLEVARIQAMRRLSAQLRASSIKPPRLERIDLTQGRFTFHFDGSWDGQERRLHLTFDQYGLLVGHRSTLEQQLAGLFTGTYVDAHRLT